MKHKIVIRMGAPYWDVTIDHNGTPLRFDFRKMERKDRSTFHREFMNAWRSQRRVAA